MAKSFFLLFSLSQPCGVPTDVPGQSALPFNPGQSGLRPGAAVVVFGRLGREHPQNGQGRQDDGAGGAALLAVAGWEYRLKPNLQY